MKDRKAVNFSILFLPALELVAALDSAGPRPAKQHILDTNGGKNPWRTELEATVSAFEISDLDHLFFPISVSIFLYHAIFREGNHSPSDLIAFFKNMDEKDFMNRFRSFLQLEETGDKWVDVDLIEEALRNDRARENDSFREEARSLVALLSSGDMFRRKLVEVLSWYHEKILSSRFETIRKRVEGWITERREIIGKDLEGVLNRLTHDSYDSLISYSDNVTILPISGSANSEVWLMLPDEAYLIVTLPYAEQHLTEAAENSGREQLTDQAVEALADPKRIAMLRALRSRPYFGKELADRLGISASTASYHIEKLVSARLVRLEISSGRRFYYALNPGGFRDLLDSLEREFLPDDSDGRTGI